MTWCINYRHIWCTLGCLLSIRDKDSALIPLVFSRSLYNLTQNPLKKILKYSAIGKDCNDPVILRKMMTNDYKSPINSNEQSSTSPIACEVSMRKK